MKKTSFKDILPLFPLFVIYILIVLIYSSNSLSGDEIRHIRYATNLSNGFYAGPVNPDLQNGPGYPLFLTPFVAFNAAFIIPKIFNTILVLAGLIYFLMTIRLFTTKKYAIFFTLLVGLYPPLIRFIPTLYSEPLTFLIICALLYHYCKLSKDSSLYWKHFVATAFFLGFLVLVKIIFLQVIICSLGLVIVLFIFNRNRHYKRLIFTLLGAILLISPYLVYAYNLTGKPLYLGTTVGEILYHRTTPYENEWGNWFSFNDVLGSKDSLDVTSKMTLDLDALTKNHGEFYQKLLPLSPIERDSVLRAKALMNIKEHPKKYLKNSVANIGRFLFHYPFSYRAQNLNAYGYALPNMFFLVFWILSLYPFYIFRKSMPFEIKAMMVFVLIYACGNILSEGRGRNFTVMIPSMVIFSTFVFTNIVKITLKNPLIEK
ncbi:MAG: hypothetical protein KJO12_02345 [Ignavibacteria bacterium]|nr:hypothetical protein [Ignavibacteria bacterium]